MRRTIRRIRLFLVPVSLLAFIAGLTVATGCFLFTDDPPDNSCRSSADCFQAQGEVCNMDTGQCELPAGDGDGDGDGD